MVLLTRPPARGPDPAGSRDGRPGRDVGAALPPLDASQAAAVGHRGGPALVLGAPGTGKTTVAVAAVLSRVSDGAAPDQCLVLSRSRVAAAARRDQISAALGATATVPAARTASSLAYGILRRRAALAGLPAPTLLSGPEQDAILRELLAGHTAGDAPAPGWPVELAPALHTRGFRGELRDLLMRVAECGLIPEELADLGHRHGRPEWVAAARVAAEYEAVTALGRPGGLDPAALLAAAADALDEDPGLLAETLPGLSLVVVDDAQDLTLPGARLVAALTRSGADLLLAGDPDAGTQGFRGGDPRLFLQLREHAPRYLLERRWRQGPELAAVTSRVAARIGTIGGTAHRAALSRPGSAPRGGAVRVVLAASPAQEARHVAEHLRRAHLLDGVAWSDMAVVVRGRSRTATLRRVLAGAGVPLVLPGAQVPLRDEPVVTALLQLLHISLSAAAGRPAVSATDVLDLLASPVGGVDAAGLRRLRRGIRAAEASEAAVAAEGVARRTVDVALVAGLLGDGTLDRLGPEGEPVRRLARAVAAGVAAAPRRGARWASGVTAETVLWALWSALGLAEPWRLAALDGGAGAARADRELDAVVALFEAAATYVDRLPGRGPDGFLEQVAGQDVAGDMLADRSPTADAVTLTTPAGAAGEEWAVVAVCGVQDGVWPDLRLRGSILRSTELVDVLAGRPAGPREALAAVRHDEARLFHVAVSRASRQLLVTATLNEDEQPSAYLDLIDNGSTVAGDAGLGSAAPAGLPNAGAVRPEARAVSPVLEVMTTAGVVARLRRELAATRDPARAAAVARRLALLAAEGVPGADPADWWALVSASDDRPRRAPDATVRVSPSRVETFGNCPLRWLLQTAGADKPRAGGAAVGTLVHAIVAEFDNSDVGAMQAALDERWPELGLPAGWLSERGLMQAREMLARVARYDAAARAQGWEAAGHEVDLAAVVGRAEVHGRIDRLERDAAGRLRVIDLKTGASKPRGADLPRHPQLGAYQVLVSAAEASDGPRPEPSDGTRPNDTGSPNDSCSPNETGSPTDTDCSAAPAGSAGAGLLQVGKAAARTTVDLQLQPPLSADEDPGWAQRLLAETAEGMAGATYEARVGDWCRTCTGRTCCPVSGDGEAI